MPFRKIISPTSLPHSAHAIRTRLQDKYQARSLLRRLSQIPSDSILPEDAKSYLKQFGKEPSFKKKLAFVKKCKLTDSLPNHLIFAAIALHSNDTPTSPTFPPATTQDKEFIAPLLESFYHSDTTNTLIPATKKHVDTHQHSPHFQRILESLYRVVNDPSGKWSHYNKPQLLMTVVCHIHQKYFLKD